LTERNNPHAAIRFGKGEKHKAHRDTEDTEKKEEFTVAVRKSEAKFVLFFSVLSVPQCALWLYFYSRLKLVGSIV
jgi:hypothetical protein